MKGIDEDIYIASINFIFGCVLYEKSINLYYIHPSNSGFLRKQVHGKFKDKVKRVEVYRIGGVTGLLL